MIWLDCIYSSGNFFLVQENGRIKIFFSGCDKILWKQNSTNFSEKSGKTIDFCKPWLFSSRMKDLTAQMECKKLFLRIFISPEIFVSNYSLMRRRKNQKYKEEFLRNLNNENFSGQLNLNNLLDLGQIYLSQVHNLLKFSRLSGNDHCIKKHLRDPFDGTREI